MRPVCKSDMLRPKIPRSAITIRRQTSVNTDQTYDKENHKICEILTFDRKRDKNVNVIDHLMHFGSQHDSQISI